MEMYHGQLLVSIYYPRINLKPANYSNQTALISMDCNECPHAWILQ